MEHSQDDPVCVIKVDVTCCTLCQEKLRKLLLRIDGVFEVSYDPNTKLATAKGKFDPLMLIEAIKKKGKKPELISFTNNPLHHEVHSTSSNSNHHHHGNTHYKEEAATSYKDKGKAKVGEKKRSEHFWHSEDNDDDDDDDDDDDNCDDDGDSHMCEDFVSTKAKRYTKDKKYHKAEAYVPPKAVDESICSDRFCKIHRRGGGIRDYVTLDQRQKAFDTFWQIGSQYPGGFFNGVNSYMAPQYQYVRPDIGFYPPAQPMSGVNDFTSYFDDDQDSRKCSIM